MHPLLPRCLKTRNEKKNKQQAPRNPPPSKTNQRSRQAKMKEKMKLMLKKLKSRRLIKLQIQRGLTSLILQRKTQRTYASGSAQYALMKRDEVDIEGGWKVGEQ